MGGCKSVDIKARYGEYALLTGGTAGIGREVCDQQLASKGLNLIVVARREAVLQEEKERIVSTFGVEAVTIAADAGSNEGFETIKSESAPYRIGLLAVIAALESSGAFERLDLQ